MESVCIGPMERKVSNNFIFLRTKNHFCGKFYGLASINKRHIGNLRRKMEMIVQILTAPIQKCVLVDNHL